MQTLLNISLQDDNTLLVSSDLFKLEAKDENTLVNWARKHIRADDYKSRHPLLMDYLIQWRRDKARETGLSAFLILTNRTLWAISDEAPMTEEALVAIHGFGPGHFEKYGEEILALWTRLWPMKDRQKNRPQKEPVSQESKGLTW